MALRQASQDHAPDDAPVVTIVGGGFSGLLTAVHLLRDHPTVRVHLIERGPRVGPGRAYATGNPDHLLNVRAANMSAFTDDPDHFRRWLEAPAGDVFVTRGGYGDYLQDILQQERTKARGPDRLVQHAGAAVAATPIPPFGWRVELDDGSVIASQALVLAVGFLEPGLPAGIAADAHDHPAYVADPWAHDLSQVPDGDILLLGSGLTMIDVALSLDSPGRRLTALSRRGLLPQVHGSAPPAPSPALMSGPLSCLRRVRRHAAKVGWRTAVDSIRWITPQIWQVWTQRERRQFLRHLRPWWDVHRHRMAPAVAERIDRMRADRRLQIAAGKVQSITQAGDQLDVRLRPRGADAAQTRRFAAVINCTSPSSDVRDLANGLVAGLHRQGLARGDDLGLGLAMGVNWCVLGQGGRPTPGLYAIGPLARSAAWETVAVPDLRGHAQEVAGAVLGFVQAR
jgi:uncharacterized NAD(P)/FAD-binding protein YdhS